MIDVATTYRHILFEHDGSIAYVTMNRPEKRNALSVAHMQELTACFKAIGAERAIAAVILRGNGPVTTWPRWSGSRLSSMSMSLRSAPS